MITVRPTIETDIPALVAMLDAQWPGRGWSRGKYDHYYRSYPEGEPISMIAWDGELSAPVAHFGVLPVHVSGMAAGLILQVLVHPSHRRGSTIVELSRASEAAARRAGARFLCGFANHRFAKVAERLLRWTILGYLRFADTDAIDISRYRSHYRFEYGDDWYRWKHGRDMQVYLQKYEKEGAVLHQLLNTRESPRVDAKELGVPSLNLWRPEHHLARDVEGWTQPLMFVPLESNLPGDLSDFSRWYVEMGDSDTFEPNQPWRR